MSWLHPLLRSLLGLLALAVPTVAQLELSSAPTSDKGGTLRVQNDSSQSIFRVYFSLTSDDSWGSDRLGAAEVIGAGRHRDWRGVTPGRYHVKVEFADGSVLDSLEEYAIQFGDTTTCIVYDTDAPTTGTLRIANDGSNSIWRVYFSLTSDDSWGSDRLGSSEVLSAGAWREWGGLLPGRYDIKVQFADGSELVSDSPYTIVAGQTATCTIFDTGPQTGTIRVENESYRSIYRVYFSLTSDDSWGSDRLGPAEVILSGRTRDWSGIPVGRYHIKIELSDGTVLDSLEEYTVSAGETVTCSVSDSAARVRVAL